MANTPMSGGKVTQKKLPTLSCCIGPLQRTKHPTTLLVVTMLIKLKLNTAIPWGDKDEFITFYNASKRSGDVVAVICCRSVASQLIIKFIWKKYKRSSSGEIAARVGCKGQGRPVVKLSNFHTAKQPQQFKIQSL